VLFDGVCGLCDRSVRWILARDRRGEFRFAPLQGETAAAVRARHPELPDPDETMVLVERPGAPDERVRVRSDAALAILARLGWPWRALAALRLLPRFLRDAAYRFVARRRARWFGTLDACRMPTPEQRERFLR
jgi:predicted DCC family thiol-disulfide oxidoreductase YuxK